eukprot:Nitzschia sp. Nitz4//scaffold18_size181773//67486//69171//NITZ4_001914-RA/size181773-processed-gene-0.48-mRNA-1//-1//CDS//3329540008//6217//frame0
MSSSSLTELLEKYPLTMTYSYGTAGFRYKANLMPPVMLRVGLAMALLSDAVDKKEGQKMGVMITASHNDESYNGLKICNPDGNMIDAQQEKLLVEWVNETDLAKWQRVFQDKLSAGKTSTIVMGRDTRRHSLNLASLLQQGAQLAGLSVKDVGVVTTPMLHHIVLHSNPSCLVGATKPAPSRYGYIQQLAAAYQAVAKEAKQLVKKTPTSNEKKRSHFVLAPLQVDGACGVGYPGVVELDSVLGGGQFIPRNGPGQGPLNSNCGSEHVQKQLKPPVWYDHPPPADPQSSSSSSSSHDLSYCCSLDGDADRIVFFAPEPWLLLDGDKISTLIAYFFQRYLQEDALADSNLSMGVVQTAYANGASTQYLQETLGLQVEITKTGVKHLHHAALEFDIGIYFEANGHGTVVFSKKYHDHAAKVAGSFPILQQLTQLIHPAVGDALSDLLLVDALLRALEWDLSDWDRLYQDFPSRQMKVQVKDRTVIQCNANETQALAPTGLQDALSAAAAAIPGGRCFVRPSGTEDVVRVYAEAMARKDADKLATQAAQIVYDTCQGVGPMPKI